MLDSKKHGLGTLVKSDGSVDHYGDFVADCKEGKGVQIQGPDKKVAEVGTWTNGIVEGEVLLVDLPDCKEVRMAIYKNGKKVSELSKSGPQRAMGPDGRVIEVTQIEIDEAIKLVRRAQEEIA